MGEVTEPTELKSGTQAGERKPPPQAEVAEPTGLKPGPQVDETKSSPPAEVAEPTEAKPPPPAQSKPPPKPKSAIKGVTLVVLLLALGIFVYGLIADRLTPYTDQATVQAYVVTLAPDVAGRVQVVNVIDNQPVKAGTILFAIDSERYVIAVETAAAQLSNATADTGASTAALGAAEARLAFSQATLTNAQAQTARVLELVNSGVRRRADLEEANATLDTATADVVRAKAEVEQARQTLGPLGVHNPEIRQAQAALRKAKRDLADTVVRAPADGAVTNLQLAPGRYIGAGQTAMSFVDKNVLWIDSEVRENSLEHIKVGDPVGIALDVRPGRVYPGRVESIGWAVDNRDVDPATGLPLFKNDTGWVREPQRFAVRIRMDPSKQPTGVRVGSQASLVFYTGESAVTDTIGRYWIALVSYLSYLN